MKERIAAAAGHGVLLLALPDLGVLRSAPLPGAGAVCAGGGRVFAACPQERAVYRLNGRLLPEGVMAAGPGLCVLRLSGDAQRLYALCADADGVLMLSAQDGAMLVFARAGVNPQAMCLDEETRSLFIAGGEDGCVHVLCADTLVSCARLSTGGRCFGVAVCGRFVHALSAGEGSVCLHTFCGQHCIRVRCLGGMPCAVAASAGGLLLAVHDGKISILRGDASAVLSSREAGSCADCVIAAGHGIVLLDRSEETLFAADGAGRLIARLDGIADAAPLRG